LKTLCEAVTSYKRGGGGFQKGKGKRTKPRRGGFSSGAKKDRTPHEKKEEPNLKGPALLAKNFFSTK